MKSNYKKIGEHIQLVDERNKGLQVKQLLGLSISKQFIPSVANIIGTDMENYKIIRKNQFACSTMQVRRDKKMPVALLQEVDEAIISQAYPIFEVKDVKELLPEYLMMWFSRAEFDREACFHAVGGVRGSLEWEDFGDMQLPIPSITKQREIVKEYNVIQNRIALNQQLIQKLEETAQALYKQWFLEFEFPDENQKPYKSNGGEMVWCEELGKEIPNGWRFIQIQKLIDENIIYNNQDGNHGEIHPKSSDFVKVGIPFIMANDINYGTIDLENCSFISKIHSQKLRIGFSKSDDVLLTHKATMGRVAIVPEIDDYIVLTPQVTYYRLKDENKITKEFLYCLFTSYQFQTILIGESEQSTRSYIGITNQRLIEVLFPTSDSISSFTKYVKPILNHKAHITRELTGLQKMSDLLLSKLATVEN
jgi:type I restriction enzyme, S subunit